MSLNEIAELLEPDSELPNPVLAGAQPGQRRIRGIRRPRDWSLMYLTPVTVLRDVGVIGTSVASEAALAAPTKARIVERVYEQELRFVWPDGADEVRVYIGPRAQGADNPQANLGEPAERVTEVDFRNQGMVPLSLPPTGAAVMLRSGKNLAGRYLEGHASTVDYPGLLRLKYSASLKAGVFRKPSAEMSVWIDPDQGPLPGFSGRPYFVAIHNEDRLPLHASDGVALVMEPKDGGASPAQRFQPSSVLNGPGLELWVGRVPVKAGFVRLFIAEPPGRLSRMALLDPPVQHLQVG